MEHICKFDATSNPQETTSPVAVSYAVSPVESSISTEVCLSHLRFYSEKARQI
jgi:hypothetical protein